MTLEQTLRQVQQLSKALYAKGEWPRLYCDDTTCWISVPRAEGLNACSAKPTFLEAATELLEELREEARVRAEQLTKAAG